LMTLSSVGALATNGTVTANGVLLTGNLGTVTSVAALTLGTTGTDLSSTVATGTTTPVITLNVPTASASNRGVLSSTDWSTFNSKAPGTTFTTNYIPYGQGTTTLNQTSTFTFNGTALSAPQHIVPAAVLTTTTQGAFAVGTLGYTDTGHVATFQASLNGYIQMEIQNTSSGAAASSDHIASNNLSTATTYYGDFGMNSSGWVGTGAFNTANMVYLTATTGDLAIGTTTSNAIHFVVANGATDAMTISSAGVTTIASIGGGNF